MLKLDFPKIILMAIAIISLTALSCTKAKENTLERPTENDQQNSNDTSQTTSDSNNDGAVAGDITPLPTKKILVANQEINVELANSEEARTLGLSGREKLDEGRGMLFDFTGTDFTKPGFWMKDMLISIDIIWINNDKIVGIENNIPLPPEDSDLPVYYPPSEITQVLEVPGGWSRKNNIVVGESVTL